MSDQAGGWGYRYRRPYVVTGGRTRTTRPDLSVETLVSTTPEGAAAEPGDRLHRAALELCTQLVSVVEVSARLDLPLGVAMVLVDDLASRGLLQVHPPAATSHGPDLRTLQRVLAGLRAL